MDAGTIESVSLQLESWTDIARTMNTSHEPVDWKLVRSLLTDQIGNSLNDQLEKTQYRTRDPILSFNTIIFSKYLNKRDSEDPLFFFRMPLDPESCITPALEHGGTLLFTNVQNAERQIIKTTDYVKNLLDKFKLEYI